MRLEVSIPDDRRVVLERQAEARGLISQKGRRQGRPNISALFLAWSVEQEERDVAAPTLLAMAKTDAARTRRIMLAALELHDGNGAAALATLGNILGRRDSVSRADWQSALDSLGLQPEIVRRWSKQRGGNAAEE